MTLSVLMLKSKGESITFKFQCMITSLLVGAYYKSVQHTRSCLACLPGLGWALPCTGPPSTSFTGVVLAGGGVGPREPRKLDTVSHIGLTLNTWTTEMSKLEFHQPYYS